MSKYTMIISLNEGMKLSLSHYLLPFHLNTLWRYTCIQAEGGNLDRLGTPPEASGEGELRNGPGNRKDCCRKICDVFEGYIITEQKQKAHEYLVKN